MNQDQAKLLAFEFSHLWKSFDPIHDYLFERGWLASWFSPADHGACVPRLTELASQLEGFSERASALCVDARDSRPEYQNYIQALSNVITASKDCVGGLVGYCMMASAKQRGQLSAKQADGARVLYFEAGKSMVSAQEAYLVASKQSGLWD